MKEDLNAKNNENKKLRETIQFKESLGPKLDETTKEKLARLYAELRKAEMKNKVHEFLEEFGEELQAIVTELKITGRKDTKGFGRVFGLKTTHMDHDDTQFAYVTWNSRRILEKVLVDTKLYERMRTFMGANYYIHHMPGADQTARNAHTIAVCEQIWGEGFGSDMPYTVVAN